MFLGIDVGSISTKLVLIDDGLNVVLTGYQPTGGNVQAALFKAFCEIGIENKWRKQFRGVGVTGSGRQIAARLIGADLIVNEISCQAMAAVQYNPEVRTVIEIGGQDSKLVIVNNGLVIDFGMNSACAAGTGSFLDHQAARLGITVKELSEMAVTSLNPVLINATCTVFAESDMINKQQIGNHVEDIVYGLCKALVSNYLKNLAHAKVIEPPVVFQGGVAYNKGMQRALAEPVGLFARNTFTPELTGHGRALLWPRNSRAVTVRFKGFDAISINK